MRRMKNATYAPCVRCRDPIIISFETVMFECEHVVHRWCADGGCPLCAPPLIEEKKQRTMLSRFVNMTPMGFMGSSYAAEGDYRRSVMMASTLGVLWTLTSFSSIVILPIKFLFLRGNRWAVIERFMFFFIFIWLWGRWVGTNAASCAALWIGGEYETLGSGRNGGVRAVFDVSVCTGLTHVFRLSDVTGSLAVFIAVFGRIWSWPGMWDIHIGNCCGVWSMLGAAAVSSFLAGSFAGGVTRETFDHVAPIHAWLVVHFLFQKQGVDPFDAVWSERIRNGFWALFFVFTVLSRN